MGVEIMANLKICMVGYTDTISVYVNDDLLEVSSLLKDAKYLCNLSQGVCKVKIIKHSGMLDSQWKKKVLLNWFSSLSGIPDFTLREAILEANISSLCFNINIIDIDQTIDIKIMLNSFGFEIIQGIEKCEDVQIENKTDDIAMKRIKVFYFLPSILIALVVIGFLVGIAIFFLLKAKICLFLIISSLIVILSVLFAYLFKKSK